MQIKFLKNSYFKGILSALAVAVFGFILLNLTFLFDAVYQGIVRWIVNLFIPLNPDTTIFWLPGLFHGSFVLVIGIISYFILKSKLRIIYKAIFIPVPTAVVLATLGIFLYRWPIILYPVGGLLIALTLYLFYKYKQPWIYYYSVILVAATLMIFTLMGGEI